MEPLDDLPNPHSVKETRAFNVKQTRAFNAFKTITASHPVKETRAFSFNRIIEDERIGH